MNDEIISVMLAIIFALGTILTCHFLETKALKIDQVAFKKSVLKPHRGTRKSAESKLVGDNKLEKGEIFFEVPDTGVGTGKGKIKMGDGIHDYSDLPYFIE